MKNLSLLTAAAALFVVISCGPTQAEYNELLRKNNVLEKEVVELKQEIENYQNTPDRLYSKVDELVRDENIDSLSVLCGRLEKYHPASPECKKANDALRILIAKKEAAIKAEKEKRMGAVRKLRKHFDDVSGITWYYNPYFVHYNESNHVSVYIGQNEKNNSVWMRLKMSYAGDDWIFFENAYLSYDGNTEYVYFDEYRDKESDNGYGGVWEWIDVNVDTEMLAFLKRMVEGKSLKMRLSGKYTRDHVLTYEERKGLEDILLAYDVLKNGE